ncbi:tripartite tricarboxylate transporter permease [Moraxella canis]|uniref:tripartite tricarboxylate transporter permease n=1 Tax=Moraxella canis TaxID=90239 RepID=UPI0006670D1C|nr:tripartite tricarboxylate transporter permease [Moraxella canis]
MWHEILIHLIPALGFGLLGAVIFAFIGVVSGTDETATMVPLTLMVIMLGAPPAGVFTFWLAGAVAKHMTHAIPTALLGIPGDTMATPMLEETNALRKLGVPHIALKKMISSAIVAAFIAVPTAVLFATLLAPFGDTIKAFAPWIFLVAAVLIAYFSKGRWASVFLLAPFVVIILALKAFTSTFDTNLGVTYFLAIAIGPLVADLFFVLNPKARQQLAKDSPNEVLVAPDVKLWRGYFPNPLKILDKTQLKWNILTSVVSSATFVFSPVAMTVVMGEWVGSRVKNSYHRLVTVLSAKNGVTESTYIAEALIPLIAFGLPLSPVAAGPAAPLFNAPPVFQVESADQAGYNLHHILQPMEFLIFGFLSVIIAALISYPFAMNYARSAALFVVNKISHEAIISTFVGLILVIGLWEGGFVGVITVIVLGLICGLLARYFHFNTGCQFMGYYVAILSVPALLA